MHFAASAVTMASLIGILKGFGYFIATLIFLPVYLAFMFVFLAVWLVTIVTGIGPISHCIYSRADNRLLQSLMKPSPGACVEMVEVAGGRKLAARWTPGSNPALPPVCIPNGLGATLITISTLHEELVAMGFPVLSYDRAGVGLSGPRPRGPDGSTHAGALEVVQDMADLMKWAPVAEGRQWILVGPSMGSIVAQCFVAVHPEMVCGVLNMDGFPYPFAGKRRRFELAAYVYKLYEAIVPTGILRPFLSMASGQLTDLTSRAFPVAVILAQMNQANFFGSLAKEMLTMMDLADFARAAWGPAFDLQIMTIQELLPLVNAQPHACGDDDIKPPAPGKDSSVSTLTWQDQPRSLWEHGAAWTPAEAAQAKLTDMLDKHRASKARGTAPYESVLPDIWPRLVVHAMSARYFNFPGGTRFFDADMKNWAAAEHTMHVLLRTAVGAAPGKRYVYPTRHHGQMFFGRSPAIAARVRDVAEDLAQAGKGQP